MELNSDAIIAYMFLGIVWLASIWTSFLHSQLKSPIRHLYAITIFPLLIVLVIINIGVTVRIAPNLLDFAGNLQSGGWPSMLVAPIAFLAVSPIAIGIFLLWVKVLKYIDSKISHE